MGHLLMRSFLACSAALLMLPLSARAYTVQGAVESFRPDLSPDNLEPLATAVSANLSKEEINAAIGRVFEKIYAAPPFLPVPHAVVKVSGSSMVNGSRFEKTLHADSNGRFTCPDLPGGIYEFLAASPEGSAPSLMMPLPQGQLVTGTSDTVDVKIMVRGDLVSVQGRITDAQGRPIAGAQVRGVPYPQSGPEERGERPSPNRSTVSDANGFYELRGFRPFPLMKVAGYLGSDHRKPPVEDESECPHHCYVDLHVEAKGFLQDKSSIPRIPMLTEDLVRMGRPLLNLLNQVWARDKQPVRLEKKENGPLPTMRGNTITGVDIVLQAADKTE